MHDQRGDRGQGDGHTDPRQCPELAIPAQVEFDRVHVRHFPDGAGRGLDRIGRAIGPERQHDDVRQRIGSQLADRIPVGRRARGNLGERRIVRHELRRGNGRQQRQRAAQRIDLRRVGAARHDHRGLRRDRALLDQRAQTPARDRNQQHGPERQAGHHGRNRPGNRPTADRAKGLAPAISGRAFAHRGGGSLRVPRGRLMTAVALRAG